MPVVITLNSYLASLKETCGIQLSINQLAELSGISQPTLSKIANNHIDGISRKKLDAILTALRQVDRDVDITDILKYVP